VLIVFAYEEAEARLGERREKNLEVLGSYLMRKIRASLELGRANSEPLQELNKPPRLKCSRMKN